MSFDQLDAQDKAICEALQAGKSDEEVMSEFGVDADKIAQLRPVVAEAGEPVEASADTPAGDSSAGEPVGTTTGDPLPSAEGASVSTEGVEGESTAGENIQG